MNIYTKIYIILVVSGEKFVFLVNIFVKHVYAICILIIIEI